MKLSVRFAASVLAATSFLSTAQAELIYTQRPSRDEVRSQLRRAPRFMGPAANLPAAFQVNYALPQDADVSVTLLDLKRMPLRTFQVAKGQPGAQAGDNTLAIWDGKDSAGQDTPAGEYWAAVSVRYADGSMENKRFRLVKP